MVTEYTQLFQKCCSPHVPIFISLNLQFPLTSFPLCWFLQKQAPTEWLPMGTRPKGIMWWSLQSKRVQSGNTTCYYIKRTNRWVTSHQAGSHSLSSQYGATSWAPIPPGLASLPIQQQNFLKVGYSIMPIQISRPIKLQVPPYPKAFLCPCNSNGILKHSLLLPREDKEATDQPTGRIPHSLYWVKTPSTSPTGFGFSS